MQLYFERPTIITTKNISSDTNLARRSSVSRWASAHLNLGGCRLSGEDKRVQSEFHGDVRQVGGSGVGAERGSHKQHLNISQHGHHVHSGGGHGAAAAHQCPWALGQWHSVCLKHWHKIHKLISGNLQTKMSWNLVVFNFYYLKKLKKYIDLNFANLISAINFTQNLLFYHFNTTKYLIKVIKLHRNKYKKKQIFFLRK